MLGYNVYLLKNMENKTCYDSNASQYGLDLNKKPVHSTIRPVPLTRLPVWFSTVLTLFRKFVSFLVTDARSSHVSTSLYIIAIHCNYTSLCNITIVFGFSSIIFRYVLKKNRQVYVPWLSSLNLWFQECTFY